jgi:ABC-type anion transport system duplicated permease subunit
VHSSGLGQDAAIEIMLAILAIMIGVLTLIAGLFAAIIAIVGIFGFQTIREEVKKRAETIAKRVSATVAKRIAAKAMAEILERAQASGLTESQGITEQDAVTPKGQRGKRKATTDKSLKDS